MSPSFSLVSSLLQCSIDRVHLFIYSNSPICTHTTEYAAWTSSKSRTDHAATNFAVKLLPMGPDPRGRTYDGKQAQTVSRKYWAENVPGAGVNLPSFPQCQLDLIGNLTSFARPSTFLCCTTAGVQSRPKHPILISSHLNIIKCGVASLG